MIAKLACMFALFVASKPVSAFKKLSLNSRLPRSMRLHSSMSPVAADAAVRSKASVDAEGTCIVGGGLAGLAAAAALRNIGGLESVRLLEKFSEEDFSSRKAGAAIQLGPNGLRALRAIGGEDLLNKIISEGTCLKGNAIIMPGQSSSEDGKADQSPNIIEMPDSTEEDTGLPQVLIRWGVLRSLLTSLLPSDAINTLTGEGIVGYSPLEKNGRKYVNPVSINGESTLPAYESFKDSPAPLLVAADGIYSSFQSLVHSGESVLPVGKETEARRANIKDNGRINIKAVAPANLAGEFKPGFTYSFFSPGGAVACFAGPAGDGFTYWAISIADEVCADEAEPRRFLSDVPPSDGASVQDQLLSKLRGLDAAECHFAIDMIEKTDPSAIFVARSEERENVGPSLVSEDGLVVLVGDSAHSMSPAYGQAASFAFEDAATLATCIREGEDLKKSLQKYSEARVSRCVEMQRRSVERAVKATRGEQTEDVSKWIFQWDI